MRHAIMFCVVALAASACTGTIENNTDTGDPSNPPPSNKVQIVVRDGFSPQAGVRVLFQTADNTVLTEMTTDASGLASADMPDGGNVTVIRTYPIVPPDPPTPDEVYTYVGVKPGDQLELGHQVDDTGTPSAINVMVPDAAQGTVKVTTACGSGEGSAPNVAISVAGCPSDLDFYVSDGGNSSFIEHATYGSNVDLSHGSLSGTLTTTLSSTNVSADIASVNAETRIVSGAYQLYSSGSKRVDAQPANINMPNLSNAEELVVATIRANAGGTQMVADRRIYAVTPTVVDASAGLIPAINDNPSFSPTGVSWLEEGNGTADVVLARIDVTRGTASPGATSDYTRVIIAPHAGTSLAMPMLSGADAIYNPTAADQIAGTLGIASATGGYDALRAQALVVSNVIELAPMNGSVTLSYAGNNAPTL